jgi:hypothetical protein
MSAYRKLAPTLAACDFHRLVARILQRQLALMVPVSFSKFVPVFLKLFVRQGSFVAPHNFRFQLLVSPERYREDNGLLNRPPDCGRPR